MSMAAHTVPPPLRDGDRLTSEEFLRRWEAMPDLKHAELVDGIVHMPSPVGRHHSRCQFIFSTWLGNYELKTPGCEGGSEGTWLMSRKDVPQPDISLRISPEYGGQSKDEGLFSAGAPELVVEVAASSRSRDVGAKLRLYERMGVREYVVVVTGKKQIQWKVLGPNGYQAHGPDADGIARSRCFPGLWLDTRALWPLDRARLFAVLQRGLDSPEHAEFAARLAAQKR